MTIGALVLCLSQVSAASGAVSERGGYQLSAVVAGASRTGATVPLSETACPTARKGLRFYTSRLNYWRMKTGVGRVSPRPRALAGGACPRYLASLFKRKSLLARMAYARWHAYHYDWASWLPAKWQRIGACETGYGHRPGNWRHSNSSYEGAFGFAKSSWDAFKYRADPKAGPYPADAWQATPRQQYEVALAIYRAFGFSGWGCRGA